jgi:hypothetical protein
MRGDVVAAASILLGSLAVLIAVGGLLGLRLRTVATLLILLGSLG